MQAVVTTEYQWLRTGDARPNDGQRVQVMTLQGLVRVATFKAQPFGHWAERASIHTRLDVYAYWRPLPDDDPELCDS